MSDTIAAGKLRAFVERIERLEEEIRELNADKSEVYKELRGEGFDVKAVRQCVAARKLDTAEREERTAIFDLYWSALTGQPSRVHVHVREEEFHPDPLPPVVDGGQPLQSLDDVGAKSDGAHAIVGQGGEKPGHYIGQSRQQEASAAQDRNKPVSASGAAATIPDSEVPAFLKPSKPLRPHCQNPSACAGAGYKHCYQCSKSAGLHEAAA